MTLLKGKKISLSAKTNGRPGTPWPIGLLAPVFLIAVLAGCAKPFASAEVIAGSEDSLTVSAGRFTQPDSFAEQYCAQYGKEAVFKGSGPLNDTTVTDIFYYDCMAPGTVSAPESE